MKKYLDKNGLTYLIGKLDIGYGGEEGVVV